MSAPNPALSVVVPVYNEADNIPAFLEALLPVLRSETRDYEVIFCVDPSTDGTEDRIAKAREDDDSVKLVVFSRRFGQPAATLAGVELASGDAVIVMDVDLQDPPALIPEMLDRWRDGSDVVVAQRSSRASETVVKRIVAKLGYRLISRTSDVEIPRDTGDFRLMDRRVVGQLLRFKETHGFLRGLVALVGFEQAIVQFEQPPRHAGKGKYNRFFGSLRIGINGLVGFSTALLSLSTVVGILAAIAAFAIASAYAGYELAGASFPVENPTIVILVLLIGGVQLICLGIAGQYIGRIYEEAKDRPRFIVDRAAGFELPDVRGVSARPRGRSGVRSASSEVEDQRV